MRQDPNKPPIGRQPYNRQVAPSKSHPWYGTITGGDVVHGVTGPIAVAGGQRFTGEQMRAMQEAGIDPATAEAMEVRRQAKKDTELYVPLGDLPPVFAFDCPIVGKRGDKVRVIAPSGEKKLVLPDGWAHRPQRIARNMWGEPV